MVAWPDDEEELLDCDPPPAHPVRVAAIRHSAAHRAFFITNLQSEVQFLGMYFWGVTEAMLAFFVSGEYQKRKKLCNTSNQARLRLWQIRDYRRGRRVYEMATGTRTREPSCPPCGRGIEYLRPPDVNAA